MGSDIRVIAGVSSDGTAHTLAIAHVVQDARTGSLLTRAPCYSRPSREGTCQHFRAAHAESGLSIMVYGIPGRTEIAIEDAILDRLATLERVKGMKDATANVAGGIVRMHRTGLEWYSSGDVLSLFFLVGGATRVFSAVGHVKGRYIMRLLDVIAAGNLELAREVDAQLASANRVIMGGGRGAAYIKQVMFALGLIDDPHPRLSLAAPGGSEIAVIRDLLRT